MATKWLEERWERLLPVLEPLGTAQEEYVKELCEAELEVWRQRPGMRQERSLQPPLSQTRTRIREHIPLTDDNWWINPKSGVKEHLALKYLNFSMEEWVEINLPSDAELQDRWDHPLPLAHPFVLVEKAEHLLQSTAWAEIVVGIGLSTGRGMVEILSTGDFSPKTTYSVSFAGPMTTHERMCAPFEVPTLVRAELVLAALSRLRQLFDEHFIGMRRSDISQQCRTQTQEAAFKHLQPFVPLRPTEHNLYKQLSHSVYPRLATLFYCPASVDEIFYMATIQNHRKTLEATSPEEQLTFALAASHLDYVIVDEQGNIDHRRGIRLGEPGVEALEVFKHREDVWGTQTREETLDAESPNSWTNVTPHSNEEEDTVSHASVERKPTDASRQSERTVDHFQDARREESGIEGMKTFNHGVTTDSLASFIADDELTDVIMNGHIEEETVEEDELEALEDRLADEFVERECEKIRQERQREQTKKAELGRVSIVSLSRTLHNRIEAVKQREGTSTPDGTIAVLLDAYEWLNKGGPLPKVQPSTSGELLPYEEEVLVPWYVLSQTTYERMKVVHPNAAFVDTLQILARLLDVYEWLIEGGLVQKMSKKSDVPMHVEEGDSPEASPQGEVGLDERGEREHSLILPFSHLQEFLDAVWSGPLHLRREGVLLTFTGETDFTFTYPDGKLLYTGNAADLRFLARMVFEDALCVSPLDALDEREDDDDEESED